MYITLHHLKWPSNWTCSIFKAFYTILYMVFGTVLRTSALIILALLVLMTEIYCQIKVNK